MSDVYCDSCGERTAAAPVCEECRAEALGRLADVVGDGWMLSNAQGVWLLAEVGRLRDTIARRGEECDAVRAERDRLAGQVRRVRDLRDLDMSGVDHGRLRVALNRLLDGGSS